MNASQKCSTLVGLLYGGYANIVIYGDISGDDYWMGRPILVKWDEHWDWDRRVRWSYARTAIATPTYIRQTYGLSDYRSQEENTDTVRILRTDGTWQIMTRDEAADLVAANNWPTNANEQPHRPIVM